MFPAPPTVKPDKPTRDISDLGKSNSSVKLSLANGRIVSFPDVFIPRCQEVEWLLNRLPSNVISPVAVPDVVAPKYVAPELKELMLTPLLPLRVTSPELATMSELLISNE